MDIAEVSMTDAVDIVNQNNNEDDDFVFPQLDEILGRVSAKMIAKEVELAIDFMDVTSNQSPCKPTKTELTVEAILEKRKRTQQSIVKCSCDDEELFTRTRSHSDDNHNCYTTSYQTAATNIAETDMRNMITDGDHAADRIRHIFSKPTVCDVSAAENVICRRSYSGTKLTEESADCDAPDFCVSSGQLRACGSGISKLAKFFEMFKSLELDIPSLLPSSFSKMDFLDLCLLNSANVPLDGRYYTSDDVQKLEDEKVMCVFEEHINEFLVNLGVNIISAEDLAVVFYALTRLSFDPLAFKCNRLEANLIMWRSQCFDIAVTDDAYWAEFEYFCIKFLPVVSDSHYLVHKAFKDIDIFSELNEKYAKLVALAAGNCIARWLHRDQQSFLQYLKIDFNVIESLLLDLNIQNLSEGEISKLNSLLKLFKICVSCWILSFKPKKEELQHLSVLLHKQMGLIREGTVPVDLLKIRHLLFSIKQDIDLAISTSCSAEDELFPTPLPIDTD